MGYVSHTYEPYSQDLRQQVLHAIDAGQSQAAVARASSVSIVSIKPYLKARREAGHVLAKAIPGRPVVKGTVLGAHLQVQLEAHPDVMREEHCHGWRSEAIPLPTFVLCQHSRQSLHLERKKIYVIR